MTSVPVLRPACLTACALVAWVGLATFPALAVDNSRVLTRPLDSDAQPFKKGRVSAGENEGTAETEADSRSGPKGEDGEPAPGGLTVFDRMGADLPPLPPEKEYKGPIDEAYGAFQRGYYLTALDKALPRAQEGDSAAQTLVAEILSQGFGVKRDTKDAAFWYGKAAEGGDPTAMFKYALVLMEGKDVPRDRAKADEWMKKAADAGNSSAQFNYAQVLMLANPGEKGMKLAIPYFEKSAEQGVADAQYAVAQLYVAVKDLEPAKKDLARDWLARAARAGYDTAQLDMGVWLINGIGGKRDYKAGFNWLKVAALRGNVAAQNKLAHLYVNAIGTAADPIEAAKWYVLSRRAGLSDNALEDFYLGLTDEQQKTAIEAANKFQPR
ncbi:sel1 repeat family protein [Rhizobiaceae bacterium n13]|uniref:Sel1 repeat family protein n=1 Tax=Ferirhizobium litorale TaxID=2927786 RepID=A0AAE3Q9B7_9HYPH|nr:tetratricopeptide repeat protein [Fererhizobium litorale]MDI7860545.1 sel1 repeat family protein [Fererhizobium litorale]MDI7920680.1 sel1 repeat family protein [Fererhizobium litorale]